MSLQTMSVKSKSLLVLAAASITSLFVGIGSAYGQQEQIRAGLDAVNDDQADTGLFGDNGVFETVINTMLFVVGAISVIMLIVGGIRYVVSAGDQNAVQGAKNTILYAIVGLVIAFVAFGMVQFVLNQLEGRDT